MGEIADMMLEGDMCQWCGEILEGGGFPTICAGCQCAHGVDQFGDPVKRKPRKAAKRTPCPECGKMISVAGMDQHTRAKHPEGA